MDISSFMNHDYRKPVPLYRDPSEKEIKLAYNSSHASSQMSYHFSDEDEPESSLF